MENEELVLTANEEAFLDYHTKLTERNLRVLNYLTDKESLEKLQLSVKQLQEKYEQFQHWFNTKKSEYKQGYYLKKMESTQKEIEMTLSTITIVTEEIENYHITEEELNRLDEDNTKIKQLAIQLFGNQETKELPNKKKEKDQRKKQLEEINNRKTDEIMNPIIELITNEHQSKDIFSLPHALTLARKIIEILKLHIHNDRLICDCAMYLTSNRSIRNFKSSGDAIRTLIGELKILQNWSDVGDFRRALQEYMGISLKYRLSPNSYRILIDEKNHFSVNKI